MSATGITLFAALAPKARPPRAAQGWGGSLLLPGLYLVGALLVGAIVVAMAGRWRRSPRSVTATASEQLTEFRSLYEKGQMSREEFERVRARLSTEIRAPEPGSPSAAAAPPAAPPATSPAVTLPPAAGPTVETPPPAAAANERPGDEKPPADGSPPT
jgi:hypothetical protein